jgi:hypothetical protein
MPPVTTSLLTGNQVAARAQAHQSVFGSFLWRRHIVAEDALVKAVSDVPTYGVSDGWLQLTASRARSLAFWQWYHALAAAERQPVRRQPVKPYIIFNAVVKYGYVNTISQATSRYDA